KHGWRCMPFPCDPTQPGRIEWASGHDNDNDNRHRFDIYLSQTHIKVYEEGRLSVDWALPAALTFTKMDVMYVQQLYHTANETVELHKTYLAKELLWRDRTPFTDHRHWDNMGFEVLKTMP